MVPTLSEDVDFRDILHKMASADFKTAKAVVANANDCDKIEGILGATAFVQMYGGFSKKGWQMSSGVRTILRMRS